MQWMMMMMKMKLELVRSSKMKLTLFSTLCEWILGAWH
jgi:hypothetical protein